MSKTKLKIKKEKSKSDPAAHRYTSLHHSIDVSGGPPSKTAFGLFSIKRSRMNRFYKDFRKEFPLYMSKRVKASTLKNYEIEKLMRFFSSNGVHMRAAIIQNKDWLRYKKDYEHRKRHFKERMYGIIYCTLLKTCSYRKYLYPVTLCKERYLFRPELAMQICRDLSSYSGYNFSPSFGDRKTNIELRFADFVAGAALKLNKRFLESVDNLKVIELKIPRNYFLKIFNYCVKK